MKKIHQYHSTKIVRITLAPSALVGLAIVATSVILATFLAH